MKAGGLWLRRNGMQIELSDRMKIQQDLNLVDQTQKEIIGDEVTLGEKGWMASQSASGISPTDLQRIIPGCAIYGIARKLYRVPAKIEGLRKAATRIPGLSRSTVSVEVETLQRRMGNAIGGLKAKCFFGRNRMACSDS